MILSGQIVLSADVRSRLLAYPWPVLSAVRALLDEPTVPNPPARSRFDWLLVALLVAFALIEAAVAEHVESRPLDLTIGMLVPFALLWRRSHPLAAVTFTFFTLATLAIVGLFALDEWEPLGSSGIVAIILAYSLLRWASGRDAAIGLAIIVAVLFLLEANNPTANVADALIASPIVLLPAVVGVGARYRAALQQGRFEGARLQERGQLARELHDSVAHHVSAIAVQAQAAQRVVGADPDAALDALEAIEQEASRTLTEMRTMVTTLRESGDAQLTPQRGIADIESLRQTDGSGPGLEVDLLGNLDALGPAVNAAFYRLAQEAVTNARRHADGASKITVSVAGADDSVQLTVTNDGQPAHQPAPGAGRGLIGMNERVELLGGRFEAGPGPERGWIVKAVVPRPEDTS